jgi:hypothetical protein
MQFFSNQVEMYKPYYFMMHAVKERMVGTKNIAKITKSMKMVSAAKLRGDQNRLSAAAPFAVCKRQHHYVHFN